MDILEDQQDQTEDGFFYFMPTVGVYLPWSNIAKILTRLIAVLQNQDVSAPKQWERGAAEERLFLREMDH
ncbi:hypothetical protein [Novipirellula rosea]|uniref:Uncharacterized protein n=1 Tax=Novipirellula rosea TaxID=1031540 RepID=A0ABP8NEK3_9BACT